MYHPELYPELASRNIEMEPLKIPQDEKHKIACSKRKVKSVEITKVSCTLNTLASNIEVASQFANRIDRDSFTNKHVIKPVLKEINEVGIKYFIPDYLSEIRYENELARQNYLEKMDNKYPSEMLHSNPEREMFAKGKVTNLLELYAKEIFLSNKSISVKDLVIEMKKVGQIDSAMDLRGLPEQENVFSELLKKRFILNNMIKKKQTLIEESKENQEETLKLTSELEIVKEEMEKVNKLLRRNVQKIYNKRRNFSNAIKTISDRSKKKTIVRRKKVEKRIRI